MIKTPLTERELEIVKIMTENPDTEYIAKRLNIAKSTTSTHITNISSKLGIDGHYRRTMIVIKALKGEIF